MKLTGLVLVVHLTALALAQSALAGNTAQEEANKKVVVEFYAKALNDKWNGVEYEIWETGAPILKNCLAAFECRTRALYDGGDHVIFLGEVLRLRCAGDGRPLLYFRAGYRALSED